MPEINQKVELNISGIIVIQSLPSDEKQTGRELYEDTVKPLCGRINWHSGLIDIESKAQFMMLPEILLKRLLENNLRPFLHFEIHGENSGLGLVLSNRELVTWTEVGSVTRSINTTLNNELFISLATCKGAYILKSINDPCMVAPFWGIIGPKAEILLNDVIEDFTAFYTEFLTGFNLQKSIDALNTSNIRAPYVAMTAEAIFNMFIEDYFEFNPLDKELKFQQLSPKMKDIHPNLSQPERDNLLRKKIDALDRKRLIADCRSIFLMKTSNL